MKSYEQLYLLIQSLTPSEKRYLKVLSDRKGNQEDSQYLSLFKALEGMEQYDAVALREQFAGDNTAKYLAVAKAYLMDVILRSLRGFHGEQLLGLKGRRLVDEGELLLEKGQLELAEKRIQKGMKWVKRLGLFTAGLELLNLYRRTIKLKGGKQMEVELEAVDQLEEDMLGGYGRQVRMQQLFDRFFAYRSQVAGKWEAEQLTPLEKLLQDPVMQWPRKALDPESQLNRAGIYAIYYALQGKEELVLVQHEMKVDLWRQFPVKRDFEPHKYLKDLLNYLDGCITLGETEKFEASIDKVKGIKTRNPKEKARRFILHYHLQLRYHLNRGDYASAANLGPGIESGLKKNKSQITPSTRLTFAYNLMVLHFIQEKYEEALHWSDLIAQTSKPKSRVDIREITPLFRLMIHSSAGNYQALERESRRVRFRHSSLAWSPVLVKGLLDGMEDPSPEHFNTLMQELEKLDAFTGIGGMELRAGMRSRIEGGKIADYM